MDAEDRRIGQWAAGFLGCLYWVLGRWNLYITLLYFLTLPFSFHPHAMSCIYSQYIRSSHCQRPRALSGAYPQSIGLAPLHLGTRLEKFEGTSARYDSRLVCSCT